MIVDLTKGIYRNKVKGRTIEKGIAFPVCVSVNDCICHMSPLASEEPVREPSVRHVCGCVCSGASNRTIHPTYIIHPSYIHALHPTPCVLCIPCQPCAVCALCDICLVLNLSACHVQCTACVLHIVNCKLQFLQLCISGRDSRN